MTWEEFLAALKRLGIDLDCPPSLMISGPAGDNATRDLQQKGVELPNDEGLFSVKDIQNSDFIWNGNLVRAHGKFSTGGHPALAGMGMVCCAGRIKSGYFFFHSGHYHPDLESALHFFADFVINSCHGLGGAARDLKVAQLCVIRLKLYVKGSEDETYSTTFAEEAGHGAASHVGSLSMGSSNSSSSPMSIRGFGRPTASVPKTITNSNAIQSVSPTSTTTTTTTTTTILDSDSPGSLFAETGINTYGRHQLKVRVHGAPVWLDDSARTKCALCNATFGTFTRKHHCRRCGEIVCDKCSGHTKNVTHPAVKPKAKEAEKQPVRVCDACFNSHDL
jgi:hypothetical protein